MVLPLDGLPDRGDVGFDFLDRELARAGMDALQQRFQFTLSLLAAFRACPL